MGTREHRLREGGKAKELKGQEDLNLTEFNKFNIPPTELKGHTEITKLR